MSEVLFPGNVGSGASGGSDGGSVSGIGILLGIVDGGDGRGSIGVISARNGSGEGRIQKALQRTNRKYA